jgi:multiple sugar transport system substrate-binding protein
MLKNKQKGNLSFSAAYAIGRDSKNKAAAWTLLSWLAGRQGQTTWTHAVGFLSARKDVKAPAGRAGYVAEAPFARPWSFVHGFDKLYDYAGKELEKAANGSESVATMLKNIDSKTKETLAGK